MTLIPGRNAIQDEITEAIVETLRVTQSPRERRAIQNVATRDVEAWHPRQPNPAEETRMKTFAILALTMALTAAAQGQEGRTDPARSGPAVSGFGEFWSIDDAAEAGDPRDGVRAVFDIAIGSEDPSEINRRIDTVARFLNMHLASGFPKDGVKAALVLHGTAARDALDNAGFEKRFGVANPNLPLLAALESAGVEIYLCGQSAASRGFAREEIAPSVDVALSAMTVLLQKQAQGYGLIAF